MEGRQPASQSCPPPPPPCVFRTSMLLLRAVVPMGVPVPPPPPSLKALPRWGSVRAFALKSKPPTADRYEFTEHNLHIMECKLAVCSLLSVIVDALAESKLDQILGHFCDSDPADYDGLTAKMMRSIKSPPTHPVWVSLQERLMPILRVCARARACARARVCARAAGCIRYAPGQVNKRRGGGVQGHPQSAGVGGGFWERGFRAQRRVRRRSPAWNWAAKGAGRRFCQRRSPGGAPLKGIGGSWGGIWAHFCPPPPSRSAPPPGDW